MINFLRIDSTQSKWKQNKRAAWKPFPLIGPHTTGEQDAWLEWELFQWFAEWVWGHSPLCFSSLTYNQSDFNCAPPTPPFGGALSSFFCVQMKGSTDVENCCLAISSNPLSRISATLLLHLKAIAAKSLLCTIEATGLKFHCVGAGREGTSPALTPQISPITKCGQEEYRKQGERERPLVCFKAPPWGWKVLLWGSYSREARQPAHLECISGPWAGGETGWISSRCFPQSLLIKAPSNLPA